MSEKLPISIEYVKTEPVSTTADEDSTEGWSAAATTLATMTKEFPFSIDHLKVEPVVMSDQDPTDNYLENIVEDAELYNYPSSIITSRVWKYFKFRMKEGLDGPPIRENLDMEYTVCVLCRRSYKFKGNTTNMQSHLRNAHPGVLDGTEHPRPCDEAMAISGNMNKFNAAKPSLSQTKQVPINEALMKLLVTKCLPIDLVDNEHFREYSAMLDSKYYVPSGETMKKWLVKKENTMTFCLKSELALLTDIAITYDCWVDVTGENFICVNAHFITKKWTLKEVALQVFKLESNYTTENVSEALQVCKNYWIPKAKVIGVCEHSSDEMKAFRTLNWKTNGCFGRIINRMVKKALSYCDGAIHLIAKGRNLVTFLDQSHAVSNMLHKKQQLLFPEGDPRRNCDLEQDDVFQWNSTYEMLQNITEQRPALMAVIVDENLPKNVKDALKNCIYSFDEQSTVQKMVSLLESFYRATLSLCAEEVPTMHKVLTVILKLERVLREELSDPSEVSRMKMILRDELKSSSEEDDDILLLATILNPFTKGLAFLPEGRRVKTKDLLEDEVKRIIQANLSAGKDAEPAAKRPKKGSANCADLDDWMNDIISEASADQNRNDLSADCSKDGSDTFCKTEAKREIKQYLAEKMPEGKSLSILQWWCENSEKYPHICQLACKYLAVPASSISSERVFNLAGNVICKNRAGLSSENVNTLTFLNKNMKYYW